MPKCPEDLTMSRKSPDGKCIYSWGLLEVVSTPRAMRSENKADWRMRELTPQRAFRKMKEKLQREIKKELKGKQHQPLVVKLASAQPASAQSAFSDLAVKDSMPTVASETHASGSSSDGTASLTGALHSLDDPEGLGYARDCYEYLDSARLHYCRNCDEEWLVFDSPWPQHGVAWAGAMAGKCETILRAGSQAS